VLEPVPPNRLAYLDTIAATLPGLGKHRMPREDRPAMKALLRAFARREVDMVAAWAVDRLGRSPKAPPRLCSILAPSPATP
jgi:hypothetical protein